MSEVEQIPPLAGDMLRRLQLTELELLIEFDRICRKNQIRYSIIGGTLLGAVRHKGFIPWDDDADVALLRSDYDAFVRACEYDLDKSRFYFQDHFQTEGYRWGYGKLRRKNTSFVRPASDDFPYEQGVYIDVMPLDYVPDSKVGQLSCNLISFILRKISWSALGKRTERNIIYNLLYRLLALMPLSALNSAYQKYIWWLNKKPSQYLRILTMPVVTAKGHSGYWRYRSAWFEEYKDYCFEGYFLQGLADADLPLRRMYGEYMCPVRFPPVSLSACTLPQLDEIQVDPALKNPLTATKDTK